MKRSIAILAGVLISGTVCAQMYGDPSRYQRRADTAPQGTVTASCQGTNGNVFQGGYNGFYSGPDGSQIAIIIQGQNLVAFVIGTDGVAHKGTVNTGPSATTLTVPLVSGNGTTGVLTLCASHLTTNGMCSRFAAGVVISNALQSAPQIYTRTQSPQVSYCVQ